MTPTRRILLAIYGLAVAFIFVWAPWHGSRTEYVDARVHKPDAVNLGYALIWSTPSSKSGYSSYAYESATIDYGRLGLEFGELTVFLLVVWRFTTPYAKSSG